MRSVIFSQCRDRRMGVVWLRPCMTREIETRLSDSNVSWCIGVTKLYLHLWVWEQFARDRPIIVLTEPQAALMAVWTVWTLFSLGVCFAICFRWPLNLTRQPWASDSATRAGAASGESLWDDARIFHGRWANMTRQHDDSPNCNYVVSPKT